MQFQNLLTHTIERIRVALRPRVFLSSTSQDLYAARLAAAEALSRKGIKAVVMDDFHATGTAAAAGSAVIVARCDALFGIYGHRFGTRADDGRSITETEYDEAKRLGLRRFCFVLVEDVESPPNDAETSKDVEDQRRFVQKVMDDVIIAEFKDDVSLVAAIAGSADEFLGSWARRRRKRILTAVAVIGIAAAVTVFSINMALDKSTLARDQNRLAAASETKEDPSLSGLFLQQVEAPAKLDGWSKVAFSLTQEPMASLTLRAELFNRENPKDIITTAMMSPTSGEIVIGTHDGLVQVVDIDEMTTSTLGRHDGRVTKMCMSADGRYAVTTSDRVNDTSWGDGSVRLWALDGSYSEVLIQKNEQGDFDCDFHPSSNRLAVASADGVVIHVLGAEPVVVTTDSIDEVQFSPLGDWVLMTQIHDVFRFSVSPSDASKVPHAFSGVLKSVRFSPDDERIVISERNGTVSMVELPSGPNPEWVARQLDHIDGIPKASFNPDGQWVLIVSDRGLIRLRQTNGQGKTINFQTTGRNIQMADFAPDGKHFVTASWGDQSGGVVWNVDEPTVSLNLLGEGIGAIDVARYSVSGDSVVTYSRGGTVAQLWGKFDASRWSTDHMGPVNLAASSGRIDSVQFVRGGAILVMSGDGAVRLWHPRARLPRVLHMNGGVGNTLDVFSKNGTVAVGTGSGRVVVLEPTSDPDDWTITSILIDEDESINSVRFSPDGR